MLNFDTALYSVDVGLTIDSAHMIDMTNFRKRADDRTLDLGSGSGVDPLVPLVTDITALLADENGWQLNEDGTYHLIYNTNAECEGCRYVIHFFGTRLEKTALGDVNLDGFVDLADILLVERYLSDLVTLTPNQIEQGDLAPDSGDGEITLPDLLLITNQVFLRP